MYIPLLTDYYHWTQFGKYWFNDEGKGAWSYLGLAIAALTGLAFAPIKTTFDILFFGYQAIAKWLLQLSVFIIKHSSFPDTFNKKHRERDMDATYNHDGTIDENLGVDLRKVSAFALFLHTVHAVPFGFFAAITKNYQNISASLHTIGVVFIAILMIPAFCLASIHIILKNLSYGWIQFSSAFDREMQYLLSSETELALLLKQEAMTQCELIKTMPSEWTQTIAPLYDRLRIFFADHTPQDNYTIPTTRTERRRFVEAYTTFIISCACLQVTSVSTEKDLNTLQAYLLWFKYHREYNNILVRNQCKQRIIALGEEKDFFPNYEGGYVFDDQISAKVHLAHFSLFARGIEPIANSSSHDSFVKQYDNPLRAFSKTPRAGADSVD